MQLSATVGYTFGAAGQPPIPIVATFNATPVAGTTTGQWTFDGQLSHLLPLAATLTVVDLAGAFENINNPGLPITPVVATGTNAVSFPDTTVPLTLSPITITSGIFVGFVSPANATATISPSISGATIFNSNGLLFWSVTTPTGTAQATHRSYQVTLSAPGYASQTVPYQLPTFQGEPFLPLGSVILQTNPITLTVTPTFTAQPGLAYPTVSLSDASGPIGSVQLSATNPSASFANLSVTDTTLQLTISGPGSRPTARPSGSSPRTPLSCPR